MLKRKYKIGMYLLIILCAIGGGIYFVLSNTNEGNEQKIDIEATPIPERRGVISEVLYGSLESSFASEGEVSVEESDFVEYNDKIVGEEKITLNIHKGDDITKGDVLYQIDNKSVKSKVNGKVISVEQTNEMVKVILLDNSKLKISVYLPLEQFQLLNYESAVTILSDGQSIKGEIEDLDYRMVEDKIKVDVSMDTYIMPGRTVDVQIALGETKEMLFIPAKSVVSMGDISYCYLVDDESGENKEYVKQEVTIGNTYTYIEKNIASQYVEVLSGLSEGQWVFREEQ